MSPWLAAPLKNCVLTQRLAALPSALGSKLAGAVTALKPQRIWIFGSRARGDARETSDFDIAFQLSPGTERQWTHFVLAMEESPPSLHKYDLVDFSSASAELKAKIKEEGILLYEKDQKV